MVASFPSRGPSSYLVVMSKTAVTGYPGAGNAVLGSIGQLLGVSASWTYQPLMAFSGGMLSLGIYGLLARIVPSRGLRALAAFVAAQPSTLYGYALVGGIKELTTATALVFCAAIVTSLRPREDGVRGILPLAIGVAALMGTFSITIGPWLAVLLILAVLATVLVRRTGTWVPGIDWPALRSWIGAGVLAIALAAPMIYWATQLAKVAVAAQGPGATALIDLGNLAAPVPARAALGVWISGDYRVPSLGDTNATLLGGVVVGILALVGLAWAAHKRDRGLLFVGIASAVALLYFTQRTGPWIQLKAICVVGPVALALAFAGVAAIRGVGRFGQLPKAASWMAAGVLTAAVLAGNAMAFHDISLAPTDRMRDLERVATRSPGRARRSTPRGVRRVLPAQGRRQRVREPGLRGLRLRRLPPDVLGRRRSRRSRSTSTPWTSRASSATRSSSSAAGRSGAARRSTTSSSTARRSPRSGSGRSG